MDAHKSELYDRIMAKLTPLFETMPVTSMYEVCSEIGLPGEILSSAEAAA